MAEAKRKRRRRAPDDKRKRILSTAKDILRESGPDALRMAELAKAAGVSEGIIFHHFKNKRGLLTAIAAEHGHGIATAMFREILPGQRPDVRRMIAGVCEFARDNRRLHDMMVMGQDPADANAAMHATRQVIIAALTQAFIQWKAAGYIETDHPDIAATLLFGLVESALTEMFTFGGHERYDEFVDEMVACIEGALGYESEGENLIE